MELIDRDPVRNPKDVEFIDAVHKFVNKETFDNVAFFSKKEDGTWKTFAQTSGWGGFEITAASETELARKYWEFWYERVKSSANRYTGISGLMSRLMKSERYKKDQNRLATWDAWREQYRVYFPPTAA